MAPTTPFKPTTPPALSLKYMIPIALLILIASIVAAKAAQDVTVKVPFDFQVAGMHFAPGTYILSMDQPSGGSLVIRSATDPARRAIALTHKSVSSGVVSAPVVMFRTYGENRFLSAVQGMNASARWTLVPSSNEADLAKTETATVASLRADNGEAR